MKSALNFTRSVLTSTAAGWRGTAAFKPARQQPAQPLELYDIEMSPFCRIVREALTELDLDVMIYPCPKLGRRFRPKAEALGGKQQFPLLHDPNTGTTLYESADIIEYLGKTYGGRVRKTRGLARQTTLASSIAASLAQAGRGLKVRPSKAPEKPLELYSFESSPYSRFVRERLCELEIPYLLRNTGKGTVKDIGTPGVRDKMWKSPKGTTRNRKALEARENRVQVPYLVDPNTGVAMFESADIIAYLDRTYAA